jgi:hypothetical protein
VQKSNTLATYRSHPGLQQRFPNFRVHIVGVVGQHLGFTGLFRDYRDFWFSLFGSHPRNEHCNLCIKEQVLFKYLGRNPYCFHIYDIYVKEAVAQQNHAHTIQLQLQYSCIVILGQALCRHMGSSVSMLFRVQVREQMVSWSHFSWRAPKMLELLAISLWHSLALEQRRPRSDDQRAISLHFLM